MLAAIARYRRDIGAAGVTSNPHLHIFGPAGVGKTRLALEICRDADWRHDVLYIENSESTNVDQLLERLELSTQARAVVVVDEVATADARRWNGLVLRASDRLRLVTIGRDAAPQMHEILQHEVAPLMAPTLVGLVSAAHPSLPAERVELAAQFSLGFPRMALFTATALERDRDLDVRGLIARGDILTLLNELVPDRSRLQSLIALAVLESVGWEHAAGAEGRVVAEHLGLDWHKVRADVDELHRAHGIAPAAGDLRYVSPRPLGVLLAAEAWRAYPERMRSLYDKLPTEASRRAYEARLRLISESKQVEAFAATELSRFRSVTELSSESAVRRWAGFGHALPVLATRYVRDALAQAGLEVRKAIGGGARRHLVWALVEHARHADCFPDALWALAHLAVAENETYANNATAEFIKRFQLVLGGTGATYLERLAALDEILASPEPAYRALAVSALGRPLATGGEFLTRGESDELAPVLPDWRPRTQQDVNEAIFGALDRLAVVAQRDSAPEVRAAVFSAISSAVMRLRHETEREPLAEIITTLAAADEGLREQLWHCVEDVLSRTERYWKDLSEDDLEWLRALLRKLEDPSLMGRTRRVISSRDWNEPASAFDAVAGDVVSHPEVWEDLWRWLLSGEVRGGAWAFGEALAAADRVGALLSPVEATKPGPDLRALAAYLTVRAQREPAGWVDDWIDRLGTLHPDPNVLIELTSRTGATARSVDRILAQVGAGASPVATEHLSYGRWADALTTADFEKLLRGLAAVPRHRGSALVLAHGRSERDAEFLSHFEDLVLDLVADPELVRHSPNHGFYWQKLADALVTRHAGRVAAAVLAAQDPRTRETGSWFLEHSTYPNLVLSRCIELDGAAVWTALRPYLEEPSLAVVYTIGLPSLLDRLPRTDVLDWIAVEPKFRGALAARLIAKNLTDDSLLLELLERFGNIREVAQAAQSEFFSGQWWGDASAHWDRIADQLRPLAARSDRPRAARWARETIVQLEKAAERERRDEAEERIRGR